MLDSAIKHEDVLRYKFLDIWYDMRYKYYNDGSSESYEAKTSNRNIYEFVSITDDGVIVGYISFHINRNVGYVSGINAVNFFLDEPYFQKIFALDLKRAMKDMFEVYKFNKIEFAMVVGNPVEKKYDRLVEKMGGIVVGIYKEATKLIDGEICDVKTYEIMREDYMKRWGR